MRIPLGIHAHERDLGLRGIDGRCVPGRDWVPDPDRRFDTVELREGALYINGEEVSINNPRDAKAQGIETIYQTLALADNINAAGNPRSWTDHLLWHHAAHTVDLFAWQAGPIVRANALAGPLHPDLGIAMDMSIQLQAESGAICTLSLSFNNDGPLGTFFRYIGDSGTYIARYDDLVTGREEPVDLTGVAVSNNGIELQDREFIAAIREGRAPIASVADVMPCYRVLHQLDGQLAQ